MIIFMEKEMTDFKYYGNFVDPMNEKAMKRFIELTHERYEAELGEEFGVSSKGYSRTKLPRWAVYRGRRSCLLFQVTERV